MPIDSIRCPLGTRLPWFSVSTLEGRVVTTADLPRGIPVVVGFLCNHSPYVRHLESELDRVLTEFEHRGVQVITIASNDMTSYPVDNVEGLNEQVSRAGFTFRYCIDPDQRAAKAFSASCTPEFFVYDDDWRLVYHGQFDASRPGNDIQTTGDDVRGAVDAVLCNETVSADQSPGFGCSIKWSSGDEPTYLLVNGF